MRVMQKTEPQVACGRKNRDCVNCWCAQSACNIYRTRGSDAGSGEDTGGGWGLNPPLVFRATRGTRAKPQRKFVAEVGYPLGLGSAEMTSLTSDQN